MLHVNWWSIVLSLVWLLSALGGAPASALVIPGPTMTDQTDGHLNWGIQLRALQDVTLDSFVYQNLGQAGSIHLTNDDSTKIFFTIPVDAGNTSLTVSPGWLLTAGTAYKLIGETDGAGTGLFALVDNFPVANAEISVEHGIFSSGRVDSA